VDNINIKVKKLAHCKALPEYKTDSAVGMDVYAGGARVIEPGGRAVVPTGFCVEIPEGFGLHLIARSGLFSREGIHVEGLIDPDYRGEVGIMIHNNSSGSFEVEPGMRIAQAYVVQMPKIEFEEVEDLSETRRGQNGYGHTGV